MTDLSASLRVLKGLRLAPYSVLGGQLTAARRMEQRALPPGPDCLFVDPAGLPMVQEWGPGAAAGASGAIYSFLGIRHDDAFPAPVRAAVRAVGDAYWHTYRVPRDDDDDDDDDGGGEDDVRQCCHVVGPNFCTMFPRVEYDEDDNAEPFDPDRAAHEAEGLAALTHAYANVLRQFARSRLPRLRLLPVSGGIFAGKLRDVMPQLTFAALAQAVRELDGAETAHVLAAAAAPPFADGGGALELCIFEESQLEDFENAWLVAGAIGDE
jgi:hypothetical protein